MIVSSLGNRRNIGFDSRTHSPSPSGLAGPSAARPPSPLAMPLGAALFGTALVGAVTLATLLATFSPSTAHAQPGNTGDKQVLNVFRPAPRELVLRINRAKKAIEAEEYSDAVLELGRLLAELEQPEEGGDPMAADNIAADSQDYFIGPKNEQGTHVSLKTEAHRLIGSMPPKGREWYELQFGAEARKLLDDAAQTGDVVQLTTASRRFFHTKAGYEATLLLGRRYMDQGQPLAAALSFKRLADSPVAADFEPELSLLLSACWYQAGLPDKAGQTLAALAKRQGNAQVQVGGGAVDLPKDEQRGVKWLSDLVGSRRSLARESLEWLMFRGNATRTGRVNADIPLVTPRWRTPTVNNPTEERAVEQLSKQLGAQGIAALPTFHPLAVDDYVIMRSADILIGVDFKSGKRIWVYPWDELDRGASGTGPNPNGGNASGGSTGMREVELKQRLWEDSLYGQLSSDGQAVFFVHGLNYANGNQGMPGMMVVRAGMRGNNMPVINNRLAALDVRRQGKLLWEAGDVPGGIGGDPRLASAFFLGPPLPLQGQLYALAEVNGEIRLVVLNARTGALEWQQQLAHMEAQGRIILQDVSRRLAGSSPSFADGVLVCPTSAGAVVAVDIATRTLLWGYQYAQGSEQRNQGVFFQRQAMQPKPLGKRWIDATVAIHNGRVVVTPVESEEMFVLDLLTGKPLWKEPYKRGESLYVACVHDNKIILVGKTQITAVGLADGKTAWSAPVDLPEGAYPSGRGIYSDKFYYVPTTAPHIVKVDLDKGKIEQIVRTEKQLGNLVAYRDEIISHGPDGLTTFPMIGPLRAKVQSTLEKNPNDEWALARKSELLAYDGNRSEALAVLRQATKLKPEDRLLRQQLIASMLEALREDFVKNRELAIEVEALVESPVQREQFLRLMAAGMQKLGDIDRAFDMFMQLASVDGARAMESPDADSEMEDLTRRHSVRRDRWIQARLATLYRDASAAQRERMDKAIVERFTKATEANNANALRMFLRNYGFHSTAPAARLTLAERLFDTDATLEAELLLSGLDRHPDEKIARSATVATFRLLVKTRQFEQAAVYAKRLEGDWADAPLSSGKTARQWLAEVQQDAAVKKALNTTTAAWPYGKVLVKEADNTTLRNASYNRLTQIPILGKYGQFVEGMSVTFDQQRNQSVVIRDGMGRETMQLSLNRSDNGYPIYFFSNPQAAHARMVGHMLYVHMGVELVALNTLRIAGKSDDLLKWRADVLPRTGEGDQSNPPRVSISTMSTPWGYNRVNATDNQSRPVAQLGPCTPVGVYIQKVRELQCLDPLTGAVIWTRSDFEPGLEIFGDEELLFVIPQRSKEAIVLSPLDGQEIARRPIDQNETRWATNGRKVLSWSQPGGMLGLKLYDAWTGAAIIDQKFPNGTRGDLIDSDEIATLQPDGQFQLLSLGDGEPKIKSTLEPENGLISVNVMRSRDDYLVVTNGPVKAGAASVSVGSVPGAINSPIINGRIYSFDRGNGKLRWPVPATIEQHGLPLEQPSDLPVLVFMRNGPNRSSRVQSSLLVLDRRDGRILAQKEELNVQTNFYEIVGKPESSTVQITMGAKMFEFTFTSQPSPPEPPAQLGTASSQAKPGEGSVGGLIGSIINALGKPGATPAGQEAAPQPAAAGQANPAVARPARAARAIIGGAVKPPELKPGEAKPAEAKPADAKPAEANAADAKPQDAKAGDAKAGEAKPSEAKPGESKPAAPKP